VLLTARFTLTAIILAPFLIKNSSYKLVLDHRVLVKIIWLSFIGICGYNFFFTYGMAASDAPTGSLIIAANPVMTTLLAAIWKKEKISRIRWAGIFLAFFGLAWIIFEGKITNALQLKLGPGNLLLLGAPLVWAIYSIESRAVMNTVPTTVLTAALVVFSLPPQAAMAISQFDGWNWAANSGFWLGVLYLGVLATGVSYLLFNEGIRLIGAARSSIFMNLIPMTAIAISYLRGQPLFLHHYIGGAIVVLGVILASASGTESMTKGKKEQ